MAKVKMISRDGKHSIEVEPVDAKELSASGYIVEGNEPKTEVKKRGKRQSANTSQANEGQKVS
jgi:hypothetical protein